jgi:predicted small metal-binding protein
MPEIRTETEEELLKLAAGHAEKVYGIPASEISLSIVALVKAPVKDE